MRPSLLCLLICMAYPAHALEPDTACPAPPEPAATPESLPVVTREILDELIGWIAIHTSYDVSKTYRDPPAISFCEVGDVVPYEDRDILIDESLRAAYDATDRRIHIVLPWTGNETYDKSVLLHELIHDVQLNNREWECIGAPEWEAYHLQDKWLQEKGVIHNFDWLVIYMLSRCPSDVHP
jgi:hypothetical protein